MDETDIILKENGSLISDQNKISDIFNNFFINVAKDIGKDSIDDENHPSIVFIREMNKISPDEKLVFKPIHEDFISKQISKLSAKKATGFDQISPKILQLAKHIVTQPITMLINKSLEASVFSDNLKVAQVVPVHKKIAIYAKVIIELLVCYQYQIFLRELFMYKLLIFFL